jgi:hypothetical protein
MLFDRWFAEKAALDGQAPVRIRHGHDQWR